MRLIGSLFRIIPLFAVLLGVIYVLHTVNIFPQYLNTLIVLSPEYRGVALPSGETWLPTYGDVFILVGLIVLMIEIFKSINTSSISILDHTVSTITLVAYLVCFMIYPWVIGKQGNSVFFLLTCMSFMDVVAGFTITIATARRDFSLGG